MGPVATFAGFVAMFFFGYGLGYGAGRASGKVAALEAEYGIDTSTPGDGGSD